MGKEKIKEIYLLRSIACLCVVLLHSVDLYASNITQPNIYSYWFLESLELLLKFGTPTFIFISELLISRSYQNTVPKNFLSKRAKVILIPYLVMAVFYALLYSLGNLGDFPIKTLYHVLGGFHGYFVLIIFQFYLLHILFIKKLKEASPKVVLLITFLINVCYLGFFNFTTPFSSSPFIVYLWERGHWMLFVGWIFYFAVAYYCGKNYEIFRDSILKYKKLIVAAPFATSTLVLLMYWTGVLGSTSKRIDMILFTLSMIFLIYLIGIKVKSIPNLLVTISQYSFGIYLLHMFFIAVINLSLGWLGISLGVFNILIIFTGAIVLSIISVFIANKLPYGKYLFGQVGVGIKKEPAYTDSIKGNTYVS